MEGGVTARQGKARHVTRKEMEAGEQSWRISVQARSGKFRFRFKATNAEPTWNLFRFSLFLRVHQFLLRLKSESKPPILGARSPRKTTHKNKSKLPRFLHKLRTPPSTSSPDPSEAKLHPPNSSSKERLGIGAMAVGSIGVLGEWVTAKEERRMVVYIGSSILVLLSLFLILNKLLLLPPLGKASRTRWLVYLIFLIFLALLLPLYLGSPTLPFYKVNPSR